MKPLASGFVTSEFWLAAAALAGKVIVLLVTLRVISSADPNALIQAVTAVILGVGTVWGISHGQANYANNRTELKLAAMQAAPAPAPRVVAVRVGR